MCGDTSLDVDLLYKHRKISTVHWESYKSLDSMCPMNDSKGHVVALWASAANEMKSISLRLVIRYFREIFWNIIKLDDELVIENRKNGRFIKITKGVSTESKITRFGLVIAEKSKSEVERNF